MVREVEEVNVLVDLLLVNVVRRHRKLGQVVERRFLDGLVSLHKLIVEYLVDVPPVFLFNSPETLSSAGFWPAT